MSGWIVKDNDDTHTYAIPAGTIARRRAATWLLDEAAFGFGLGGADSARLFDADGATLVDSYTWTAHAATTYGRCPDGTGAVHHDRPAPTKGAANACAGRRPDRGRGPAAPRSPPSTARTCSAAT